MDKLSFNRTDTTAGNLRMEGSWENIRNRASKDLFVAMLQEAFAASMPDPDDVMIAHHLTVVRQDIGVDAATGHQTHVEVVEEFPSADTLMFDVNEAGDGVMQRLFPENWREVVVRLAVCPVEKRDALLATLFSNRKK